MGPLLVRVNNYLLVDDETLAPSDVLNQDLSRVFRQDVPDIVLLKLLFFVYLLRVRRCAHGGLPCQGRVHQRFLSHQDLAKQSRVDNLVRASIRSVFGASV